MGTANSRGMDASEEVEHPAESIEVHQQDAEIAQLLQYLIRSGQIHIIASDPDESSEEDNVAPPPRTIPNPNTDNLDKSSFKAMTNCSSGFGTSKRTGKAIVSALCARERGLPGCGAFTSGDRCKIMNNFLPNFRRSIASFRSKIFCGAYSADGNKFITASQDRKLRLFDTSASSPRVRFTTLGRNVGWSILDTAFTPDGQYIAYSSWSESVHLLPINGDGDRQLSLLINPSEQRFCIFSLKFSSDGKELLCGANDSCIYIYDRGSERRALKIPSHDDDVNTVAFADDSSQIVYSAGDDGIVKVWDRRTLCETDPAPVGMLAGHMDGITHVEPRGDGRHLLSNSKDQSIKLWDVRLFSSNQAVTRTKKAVEDQSWDYRWQEIPKTLKNPWKRVPGDTSLMTYCGHSVVQTLCRCHFSPIVSTGQRFIYVGCALTGRIIIYDALTGKVEKLLKGHKGCVRDVGWHPYRAELMSTSWDGHVYQWTYSCEETPARLRQYLGPLRRSQRIRERVGRTRPRLIDSEAYEGTSYDS